MHRRKEPLLPRAIALSLPAFFALPSCFTFSMWRAGNRPVDRLVEVATAEPWPTLSTRIACRLQATASSHSGAQSEPALAALCAQWRPPLAPGDWIAVEPLEHAEVVAFLWRDHPDDCVLQVVRGTDAAAAPRCLFVFPQDYASSIPDDLADLPGLRARVGIIGAKRLVFEAECRIERTVAPDQLPTASVSLQLCDPPPSTLVRVLSTPLTLVLDGVFLPFELIGIASWW